MSTCLHANISKAAATSMRPAAEAPKRWKPPSSALSMHLKKIPHNFNNFMRMKTISSYLMISLALLGAVACNNSGFKRTQSGLRYKIFSDGKGPVAKKDEFVKMEILQKVRDSVFMSTYGSVPYYLRVDSPRPIYSPTEILTLMRKGDSAITVLSGDTIRRHNGGQLPAFMKKKDNITITMKILDI